MRDLWVATLVMALSLAGCSEDAGTNDGPVTCPDGRTVTPGEHVHEGGMEHNESEEMSEMEMDPCFVQPTVTLDGLPESLGAYVRDAFQWSIDNGTVPSGHSMLTSFRYSTEAADAASLAGPETWGTELVKFEHNNLPVSFDGQIFFNAPGTYYLRAYAEVRGTDFSSSHYWSDEYALNVTPVLPTGTDETVTRGPGPHVSNEVDVGILDKTELAIQLGDGVIFANDHVQAVEFTFQGACPATGSFSVPADGTSETFIFIEPGLCTVTTDDTAPQEVEIRTASPA